MNELSNIKEFIGFPEHVVLNHFLEKEGWEDVPCFNDNRSILVNREKEKSIKLFVGFTEEGVMEVEDIQVLDYIWTEDSIFAKALEQKPVIYPHDEERSWTEDFKYENGNYSNICKLCDQEFHGHKHRYVCKKCIKIAPAKNKEPKMTWKRALIFTFIILAYIVFLIYMATR